VLDRKVSLRWIESIQHFCLTVERWPCYAQCMESQLSQVILLLDNEAQAKGTPGRWALFQEKQRGQLTLCIKRSIYDSSTGRKQLQRLPAHLYKQFRDDKPALEAFVVRLNHRRDQEAEARQAYEVRSAHITKQDLEEFRGRIGGTSPGYVDNTMRKLRQHFLQPLLALDENPANWAKDHIQTAYAEYLREKAQLGTYTINNVCQIGNSFLAFLHRKYPVEYPSIKLMPVSKAQLKYAKAEEKMEEHQKYIFYKDYLRILEAMPEKYQPYTALCYFFGLRRNESSGLQGVPENIWLKGVRIDAQREPKLGGKRVPTKGRLRRLVPYWFCSKEEAAKLVESLEPISCDVFTTVFGKTCRKLGMPYTTHDLRHTFAHTVAMYGKTWLELRSSLGHTDNSVTNKYLEGAAELLQQYELEDIAPPLLY
jgi:integrase